MQLKSINIVNYKGIEDLTVNFSSGVNLVIGNNGTGKSSLLAGISLALKSLLVEVFDGYSDKELTRDEVRSITSLVGSVTESVKYCTPVSIRCNFELDDANYNVFYEYARNYQGDVETHKHKAINKMKELVNDKNSRLPLLSYQGDKRQFFTVNDEPDLPRGQIERRQGYKDCLSGMTSVDAIQSWCAQMDYAGYRLRSEPIEYLLFKNIVSRFISSGRQVLIKNPYAFII